MDQHSISLIDVLTPPVNQWLKELSRRKANLPSGVRVVRFSESDEDGIDSSDSPALSARSPRKMATVEQSTPELAKSEP